LAKIILQNVEYKSNMTGATSGAGTTFLPELQNMTGATSGAGTTFLPKLQNMTGATSGAGTNFLPKLQSSPLALVRFVLLNSVLFCLVIVLFVLF
jgi:hypothetical protein